MSDQPRQLRTTTCCLVWMTERMPPHLMLPELLWHKPMTLCHYSTNVPQGHRLTYLLFATFPQTMSKWYSVNVKNHKLSHRVASFCTFSLRSCVLLLYGLKLDLNDLGLVLMTARVKWHCYKCDSEVVMLLLCAV